LVYRRPCWNSTDPRSRNLPLPQSRHLSPPGENYPDRSDCSRRPVMRLFPTLLATGLCLGLAVPASAATPESKILTHTPVGTQVVGSDNQGSAPVLEPGMSQDMLPATGENGSVFYKLPQIQEGERLHVSTQLILDPMQQPTSIEQIKLKASLVQSDGKSCNSNGAYTSRRSME